MRGREQEEGGRQGRFPSANAKHRLIALRRSPLTHILGRPAGRDLVLAGSAAVGSRHNRHFHPCNQHGRGGEREAACCGATAVRNEQPTDYEWSGQPGRPTCLRTDAATEAHIDCSLQHYARSNSVRSSTGAGERRRRRGRRSGVKEGSARWS